MDDDNYDDNVNTIYGAHDGVDVICEDIPFFAVEIENELAGSQSAETMMKLKHVLNGRDKRQFYKWVMSNSKSVRYIHKKIERIAKLCMKCEKLAQDVLRSGHTNGVTIPCYSLYVDRDALYNPVTFAAIVDEVTKFCEGYRCATITMTIKKREVPSVISLEDLAIDDETAIVTFETSDQFLEHFRPAVEWARKYERFICATFGSLEVELRSGRA